MRQSPSATIIKNTEKRLFSGAYGVVDSMYGFGPCDGGSNPSRPSEQSSLALSEADPPVLVVMNNS